MWNRVSQPVAFATSSLGCAGLDWVGVLALHAATGSLAVAVGGARVVSASVNFLLNRWLFQAGRSGRVQPRLRRQASRHPGAPMVSGTARPTTPAAQPATVASRGPAGRGTWPPCLGEAMRYAILAAVLAGASDIGLRALTAAGLALALAKPVVDTSLFVASYVVQRCLVFRPAEVPVPRMGRARPVRGLASEHED